MAPPKQVCSIYAEVYALYSQLLTTLANIKAALSKAIKVKNAILYGTLSVLDAASAQLVASATTIVSAVSSQVLSSASSLLSTALEAFLAPVLQILLSGPGAMFALVGLPLEEAIKATDKESQYLSRAKSNLDLVISIFAKWTTEFGGGKYASKMEQALPLIISAIQKCSDVIDKLDVDTASGLSAQFDQSTYNSMRADITSAIEITKSDPILVNQSALETKIQNSADAKSEVAIANINAVYETRKNEITAEYLASDKSADDVAKYSFSMKEINAKKKIDIEGAKMRATNEAVLDPKLYSGVLNNVGDQFVQDMSILSSALQDFIKNISRAYLYYKASQSLTYSTYTIRNLINTLISSMIRLMGIAGNGAGEAVEGPLRLSKSMLEEVQEIYEDSLSKFYSTTQTISSTGLATNLGAGHGMLTTVDNTLAASITESLINAINADEALNAEQVKMNVLFTNIEEILDWDGTANVWGTNPSSSTSPPYARLIASSAGIFSTMAIVGMVPNKEAVAANRNKLAQNARQFRSLVLHNSEVSSALRSYRPKSSPLVEELKRAINPALMKLFLSGPAAFNVISMTAAIAGDAITQDSIGDLSDIPTLSNCKIYHPDLFGESIEDAKVASDSLRKPAHFNKNQAAYMEQTEMKRVKSRGIIRDITIDFEDTELDSSETSPEAALV